MALDHAVVVRSRGFPVLGFGSMPTDARDVGDAGYQAVIACVPPPHAVHDEFRKRFLYTLDPFTDDWLGGMSRAEKDAADRLAATATKWARRKTPVFVFCREGRNRSALVTALTLVNLGAKPEAALELVREKRGKAFGSPTGVLTNRYFVEFLLAR